MRRLLAALATCTFLGCAAEAQLSPPPPQVIVAPAPPAPPPGPPPLLVVPRAEASPQHALGAKEAKVERLRSEGKRHALERTSDGVVVAAEDRGVLGFLRSPVSGQPIRWAGFVEEDAVVVVAGARALRAASVEDALGGRFEPASGLDPSVEVFASAGKIVVAAAPAEGGPFQVSSDGGRTFAAAKRPGKGAIVDLAVRGDGFAAAALRRGEERAEVLVGRGAKGFGGALTAEIQGAAVFARHGDAITVFTGERKGQPGGRLGLDARGRWVAARYPTEWLDFAWTSSSFEPRPPTARPGLPAPPRKDDELGGVVGGVVGGMMAPQCQGVACLRGRPLVASPPALRAFQDAVCARADVVERVEIYDVIEDARGHAKKVQQTFEECRGAAPAQRTSTLILGAGEGATLLKAPADCAAGRVAGTDRTAFLRCSAEHGGRARVVHVGRGGAFTDVAEGVRPDDPLGAESASDGTTLLSGERHAWLCRTDAPSCAALPPEGLLAARPLPGGRALIARTAGPQEILLELYGEAGASAVRVAVQGNVLDLEVTAEGHVRLWRSDRLTSMATPQSFAYRSGDPPVEAYRVGADGALVPDPAARGALLEAIAAARVRR